MLALKDGTLKGILWHQREGDSGKKELAESYTARLRACYELLELTSGVYLSSRATIATQCQPAGASVRRS